MCFLKLFQEILRCTPQQRDLPKATDLEPSLPLNVEITDERQFDLRAERQVALGPPLIEILSSATALHQSKALENSFLGEFPQEIIIRIAECLLIASAASFNFCSNAIKNILGARYWEALEAEVPQLELPMFWTLLERDLPDYIFCYHCMILHTGKLEKPARVRKSIPDNPLFRRTSCYVQDFVGGPFIYLYIGFRSSYFRMAMKQYRLGLDSRFYLDLLARDTCRRGFWD
jgi:hypothetical protein